MKTKERPRHFESESAERAYWEANDSVERVDWPRAVNVRLPTLKPSTQAISIRLPLHTL